MLTLPDLATRAEQARRVLDHRYEGACPDGIDGWDQRDPECPACIALDAYIEAARRLADVIEYAETVAERTVLVTFDGTRHMDPRLVEVLRIARGETTNERENDA